MTGGFADALSDLRREGLVTQMPIRGLSEPETADLVALQTGTVASRSFVRELHAETEGNPFFIGEIVRHLSEAGVRIEEAGALEVQRVGLPEGVKEVIARRLARLDTQAIEWLRVASVIGRDFDAGLLEDVLSFNEDEFLNVLEEVLASSLVVEVQGRHGRYSFSHALIRETLYEGMSAPRRARIHRRVGEVLEARDPERYLTSLALHFTRAAGVEDAEKAIQYAQRAGEQASAMLAHEEAADHYARALEVQDRLAGDDVALRCELLLMLGEARVREGERPRAWPTFREAATLAIELGDSSRLARAAIGASRRYIQPPGVVDEDLIALLEQALSLTEGDPSVRVALLTRLCGVLYYSPRRGEMVALAAEATELATQLGDPEALALAAGARRRAFWAPNQLEQRLADSTALLTLAREAGDLELVLQGHAWLVVDLLEQGQPDAVEAQMEAFNEGARRLRQPLYTWQASIWLAMRALLEGRLDDADRLAADALAAGSHGETVTAPQYYAIQLLAIRREQDRMAELEEAARDLLASNPYRPAWRAALLTLVWELGRADEARQEFETAMEHFERAPRDGDWLIAATLLADAAAELGDRDRAARMYELMLPYRHGNVVIGLAAVCLGSAARYLGRLAMVVGQSDAAIEHFDLALAGNAALGTPVYLAHTRLDYARALGPGAGASELIEAAAKTAAELGLANVARRAQTLRER
jgi:tetratricopeptide (TPR) repeat protein